MKNKTEFFLTDAEKNAIQNTVKEVEKTTSGEIVPMIVSRSYTYPLSNLTGGLFFGIILAIAGCLIVKNENMWVFLAFFSTALLLMHRVIEFIPPLKRLFISRKEIDEEVEEAALTAFYKSGLYKTKDQTGVLLYISLFEKRVWILGDKGINAVIPVNAWQGIVDEIIQGIKTTENINPDFAGLIDKGPNHVIGIMTVAD